MAEQSRSSDLDVDESSSEFEKMKQGLLQSVPVCGSSMLTLRGHIKNGPHRARTRHRGLYYSEIQAVWDRGVRVVQKGKPPLCGADGVRRSGAGSDRPAGIV
eukprot:5300362-Prymnesium_polylepis.2